MAYQFIDAYGSVLTASSNVVGGAHQPIVQVSSIIGSIPVTQSGSWSTSMVGVVQTASILGTYAEDATHTSGNPGIFTLGVRNDSMSSITSADGEYSPITTGSIGETIVANSPITKWFQTQTSVMYGTSVQALAPQGSSVFTYVTGVQVVNNSANQSLVKFTGGLGSVLAWTIAPANGGSNITFPNGLKTGANSGFSASISGISSIYVSAQGFISNT